MRAKCARFSSASFFLTRWLQPTQSLPPNVTIYVCCVCVLACSHTFVALCGICYNFKCYTRQNEAKLAPIVATSVWPDILARARSTWRVCEPLNADKLPALLPDDLPTSLPACRFANQVAETTDAGARRWKAWRKGQRKLGRQIGGCLWTASTRLAVALQER